MKYLLMGLIRLYQWTISPLLGPVCKYYPSCSHYGYEAVRVHGAVKGSALAGWRILRCNPWSAGGVDHVPPRKAPPWHRRLRDRFLVASGGGHSLESVSVDSVSGAYGEAANHSGSVPDNAVGPDRPRPASAPNAQGA
ncbi:membrane protein insertion efficiency factor YidD [Mangrovactinospora gilvigrisea]|uniref:Putative membrane protein insertion efficiency factor n=1 Tax=Mangrovactinospora gilvigrisea TaxID=1428644 RepID=A0A1J7BEX2_9ACTN|nr:membrane protein insertion efficiency factor YidD [Mangrovactinospora gilvigrisea]OIV37235.1 membrane protein insertion efficiency factor YidD [Mangrovactinospora gilvigrisea]